MFEDAYCVSVTGYYTVFCDSQGETIEVVNTSQPLLFTEGAGHRLLHPALDGRRFVIHETATEFRILPNTDKLCAHCTTVFLEEETEEGYVQKFDWTEIKEQWEIKQ